MLFLTGRRVHVKPGQQNPQCHLILTHRKEYFLKCLSLLLFFVYIFHFLITLLRRDKNDFLNNCIQQQII